MADDFGGAAAIPTQSRLDTDDAPLMEPPFVVAMLFVDCDECFDPEGP